MSTYDQLSPYYDLLTVSERPYRRQALDMLDLAAGETMLEIGCGTGQTLLEAAPPAGQSGLLIGLDLSAGMLAQAGQKIAANQVPALSLVRGSGLRLPLAANSCDAVFMGFTLELLGLADQHRLLAETRRVLKNNGRLALVTLSAHKQTVASGIYWSLHELFPATLDCRPINPAPLLAAAGFTVWQLAYASMFGLPIAVLQAGPGR
jgi:ubiquinone/menaquinone biosynthesis C-methylase UbiE